MTERVHYGDGGTIHQTGTINVEVHNGEVVAVWFRCMRLPFTVDDFGPDRAREMKAPTGDPLPRILAIDVEMPSTPR